MPLLSLFKFVSLRVFLFLYIGRRSFSTRLSRTGVKEAIRYIKAEPLELLVSPLALIEHLYVSKYLIYKELKPREIARFSLNQCVTIMRDMLFGDKERLLLVFNWADFDRKCEIVLSSDIIARTLSRTEFIGRPEFLQELLRQDDGSGKYEKVIDAVYTQ